MKKKRTGIRPRLFGPAVLCCSAYVFSLHSQAFGSPHGIGLCERLLIIPPHSLLPTLYREVAPRPSERRSLLARLGLPAPRGCKKGGRGGDGRKKQRGPHSSISPRYDAHEMGARFTAGSVARYSRRQIHIWNRCGETEPAGTGDST